MAGNGSQEALLLFPVSGLFIEAGRPPNIGAFRAHFRPAARLFGRLPGAVLLTSDGLP